ncbi:MAG: AMP-binding protein [Halieaceae bacterium]|jgi:long-chain acyl-CoA synthetase|nr:AMP-binding protein [Halieaceae bacterium]
MAKLVSGLRESAMSDVQVRAAQAASGFNQLGVEEGDAVALLIRNDFAFFEAAIGAALLGAYAVPVNWHFRVDEVRYILEDSGARVLVVHADLLHSVQKGFPENLEILVVPTPTEISESYQIDSAACIVPDGHIDWNIWLAEQQVWNTAAKPKRNNVIYTSGTTGKPKGVMRMPETPETTMATVNVVRGVFGIEKGTLIRTVLTGPIYHSAPNAYALASAASGGDVILQPRFDPEELLSLIEQYSVTHLHMVPTMFVRLLKLPEAVRSKYDLSSLEFVVHAAAPCPPDVKRAMIEWWGPVINEYYGGTETGPVVFHNSEQALSKPGTVGQKIVGIELKVIGSDGRECAAGEAGELFMVNRGYSDFTYKNQEQKRQEIDRSGLLTIGDIGYMDEDGYLFICDRARDMVISGGVNIYPAEIEGVLLGMSGVKDCAVFGIPSEEFGESLCAHVDVDPNAITEAGQVRDWLVQRIAKYKVPRIIVFDNQLPREDSGKIMKRKIRDTYWRETTRAI